jgi:hypothetical protein
LKRVAGTERISVAGNYRACPGVLDSRIFRPFEDYAGVSQLAGGVRIVIWLMD